MTSRGERDHETRFVASWRDGLQSRFIVIVEVRRRGEGLQSVRYGGRGYVVVRRNSFLGERARVVATRSSSLPITRVVIARRTRREKEKCTRRENFSFTCSMINTLR
ncbi:hypothetical protein Dimus_030031 [Dionaea muscipula]